MSLRVYWLLEHEVPEGDEGFYREAKHELDLLLDKLHRYEGALEEIANPEVWDADWRQMRRVANRALGL